MQRDGAKNLIKSKKASESGQSDINIRVCSTCFSHPSSNFSLWRDVCLCRTVNTYLNVEHVSVYSWRILISSAWQGRVPGRSDLYLFLPSPPLRPFSHPPHLKHLTYFGWNAQRISVRRDGGGGGGGRTAGHHEDQRMLAQNLTLGDLFGFIFRRFLWFLEAAGWSYRRSATDMLLYRINRACIGYIKCSHFAKIDEFGEKPADTLSLLPIIVPVVALFPLVCLSTQISFFLRCGLSRYIMCRILTDKNNWVGGFYMDALY